MPMEVEDRLGGRCKSDCVHLPFNVEVRVSDVEFVELVSVVLAASLVVLA